jgi:pimeloyl-ACP methyl ester carboxylesterase
MRRGDATSSGGRNGVRGEQVDGWITEMIRLYSEIEPFAQACSTLATATASTGRVAATRSASRRWCCTAAQAREPAPPGGGSSTRRSTGWSCSTSGRSTPDAGDVRIDLSTNTMPHLVSDIEKLRAHLEIDRWLLVGGSWGSALGLGYAQQHPDRITDIVLFSVVTSTPAEHRWLTRDLGRVFPEQWERFRDAVPAAERDGNLPAAYARLLADPDGTVRTGLRAPGATGRTRWSPTCPAAGPTPGTKTRRSG